MVEAWLWALVLIPLHVPLQVVDPAQVVAVRAWVLLLWSLDLLFLTGHRNLTGHLYLIGHLILSGHQILFRRDKPYQKFLSIRVRGLSLAFLL